jgi:hypothetical protein
VAAAAVLVWVRRTLPPALTLLALAAVWLPVNSRLEGAVLVAFGPRWASACGGGSGSPAAR